jgi:hypothetical protein
LQDAAKALFAFRSSFDAKTSECRRKAAVPFPLEEFPVAGLGWRKGRRQVLPAFLFRFHPKYRVQYGAGVPPGPADGRRRSVFEDIRNECPVFVAQRHLQARSCVFCHVYLVRQPTEIRSLGAGLTHGYPVLNKRLIMHRQRMFDNYENVCGVWKLFSNQFNVTGCPHQEASRYKVNERSRRQLRHHYTC